jgi:hypothetical protein
VCTHASIAELRHVPDTQYRLVKLERAGSEIDKLKAENAAMKHVEVMRQRKEEKARNKGKRSNSGEFTEVVQAAVIDRQAEIEQMKRWSVESPVARRASKEQMGNGGSAEAYSASRRHRSFTADMEK